LKYSQLDRMPCGARGGRAVGHLCTGPESCFRPPDSPEGLAEDPVPFLLA
jgi:hypothetical protein